MNTISNKKEKNDKWYQLRYQFRRQSKIKLIDFVLDLIIYKAFCFQKNEEDGNKRYDDLRREFFEIFIETKKYYQQYQDLS